MKTQDFTYHLSDDRIAQEPCIIRDRSRMMVVDRHTGRIDSRSFSDLPELLGPEDILVVNDSRVIPARLTGRKDTGGRIEMLLLERQKQPGRWHVMVRPAKRVSPGTRITFGSGDGAVVLERVSDKTWAVDFEVSGDFDAFLDTWGTAPLPPYIKRSPLDRRVSTDRERYQTVYAAVPGSIAAPTAGLHFSESILAELRRRGIPLAPVTLHVGAGTFSPIETEYVEDHEMERERYRISEETARSVNRSGRVVAVGTTSVRALESAVREDGAVRAGEGTTDLYIFPGFAFRVTGALLTNFHLPASSLFVLVCAFGGTGLMQKAYGKAIEEGYRFYSYGDCMLIL